MQNIQGVNVEQWYSNENINNQLQSSDSVFALIVSTILAPASRNTISPLDIIKINANSVPSTSLGAVFLKDAHSRRLLKKQVDVSYQIKFYPNSMGASSSTDAFTQLNDCLVGSVMDSNTFTNTMQQVALERGNTALLDSNSTGIASIAMVVTSAPSLLPVANPTVAPTTIGAPSGGNGGSAAPKAAISTTDIIIAAVVLVFSLALIVFVYFTCRKDEKKLVVIKRTSVSGAGRGGSNASVNSNPIHGHPPPQNNIYGGQGYQGPMDDQRDTYPNQADMTYGHGSAAFVQEAPARNSRGSFARQSFDRRPSAHDQMQQMMATRRFSAGGAYGGDSTEYQGGDQRHPFQNL